VKEDLPEAETLLTRPPALRPDDGAIADSYGYCLFCWAASARVSELKRADSCPPAIR
jgi:hypothetical protein